jgi:hypothetical protein
MTSSGLSGGGSNPPPSIRENQGDTPRPYKTGVLSGMMDMDAFVTDMSGYWPAAPPATSAAQRMHAAQCLAGGGGGKCVSFLQRHIVAAIFALGSVMLFWCA